MSTDDRAAPLRDTAQTKHLSTLSGLSGSMQISLLFGAVFAAFTSIGIALPVLPVMLNHGFGASSRTVGVIMGLHAAVAIIGRPLTGRLITRRGPRIVLAAGAMLLAAGGAMYGVLPTLAGVTAARVVVGVGDACVMIAGAAWALALLPVERHGRGLGLFGLATWAGVAAGPLIGAALSDASGGNTAVWLATSMAACFSLMLTVVLPAPPDQPPASARLAFFPRVVIRPGLALASGSAGYALVPTFIVLLLSARGSTHGAWALAGGAGAFIVARLASGPIFARWSPHLVASGAAVIEAVGLAVIGIAPHAGYPVVATFIGTILAGAGTALLFPSLALVILRGVLAGDRANALGAYIACWDVGMATGAALLGLVITTWGYDAGCGAAACFALGSMILASRGMPEASDAIDQVPHAALPGVARPSTQMPGGRCQTAHSSCGALS